MEFRQLQHFLIAAQENSFSKAADKIYISQQALSKSIAALEQELKVPLFQRTHRGVSLTEQGRIFQKKAYAIMEMMNNTLIEMQNLQAVQNQSIPLSVTSGLENWLDIEYLLAFSNRYPEYTICTRADDDIQIEEKIIHDAEEIGIVGSIGNPTRLDTVRLLSLDTLVAVSRSNPLSRYECVPFSALANENFILTHSHHYANTFLITYCNMAGFVPKVCHETAEINYTARLVAANQGIFFLPALSLSASAFREEEVGFLRLEGDPKIFSINLVKKRGKTLSRGASLLYQYMIERYRPAD